MSLAATRTLGADDPQDRGFPVDRDAAVEFLRDLIELCLHPRLVHPALGDRNDNRTGKLVLVIGAEAPWRLLAIQVQMAFACLSRMAPRQSLQEFSRMLRQGLHIGFHLPRLLGSPNRAQCHDDNQAAPPKIHLLLMTITPAPTEAQNDKKPFI